MFTIDLNKVVKTEKVMIVIKQSIDNANMNGVEFTKFRYCGLKVDWG
jgi:hypothetical protein